VAVQIILVAAVAAIAAWWLLQQRLTAKPWLEEGPLGEHPGTGASPVPAAKLGLWVFLAVASSLFALFASAYFMRMHMGDWRPLPLPKLLWLNTAVLVLSSVALQRAVVAARRGQMSGVTSGVLAGAVSALLFLVGQLVAWRQLSAAGYFLAANPANSFFYLITAVHGLHLLGGLAALGKVGAGVWRGRDVEQVRPGVELCATYWHFLLLVWIALLALLLHT
jgi:cytochrome c oxidase subunit 3